MKMKTWITFETESELRMNPVAVRAQKKQNVEPVLGLTSFKVLLKTQ